MSRLLPLLRQFFGGALAFAERDPAVKMHAMQAVWTLEGYFRQSSGLLPTRLIPIGFFRFLVALLLYLVGMDEHCGKPRDCCEQTKEQQRPLSQYVSVHLALSSL